MQQRVTILQCRNLADWRRKSATKIYIQELNCNKYFAYSKMRSARYNRRLLHLRERLLHKRGTRYPRK